MCEAHRNVKLVSRTLNNLYSYMWPCRVKGQAFVQAVARPAIYDRTLRLWQHINLPSLSKDAAENLGPNEWCNLGVWPEKRSVRHVLRVATETMKPQRSRTRAAEMGDLVFKSQGSGDYVATQRGKGERKGGRRYSSIFHFFISIVNRFTFRFISYVKGVVRAKEKAITVDRIVA